MDIEKTIKEVAQYFKNKVLTGDYEFLSCSEYTAKIEIDKKYTFEMWIANAPESSFDFYETPFLALTNQGFIKFSNQKDRLKGWRKMKPRIEKYRATILKSEKEIQIAKLQEELKSLEK